MRRVGLLDKLVGSASSVPASPTQAPPPPAATPGDAWCRIGNEAFDDYAQLSQRVKEVERLGRSHAETSDTRRYRYEGEDEAFLSDLLRHHAKAHEKTSIGRVAGHAFDLNLGSRGKLVVQNAEGIQSAWSAKRVAEHIRATKEGGEGNIKSTTAPPAPAPPSVDSPARKRKRDDLLLGTTLGGVEPAGGADEAPSPPPPKAAKAEKAEPAGWGGLCLVRISAAEALGCFRAAELLYARGFRPRAVQAQGGDVVCVFDACEAEGLEALCERDGGADGFLGYAWKVTGDASAWEGDLRAARRAARPGRTHRPEDNPEGLTCLPDFLTEEEEQALLDAYAPGSGEWDAENMERRVAQYGYRFDYDTGHALHALDKPLPDVLQFIVRRMQEGVEEGDRVGRAPDQVIVNEYLPGQGIGMHTDRTNLFDDTIYVVSVGSDACMTFTLSKGGMRERVHVPVPRRSCYVMQGDSRFVWQHGLAGLAHDTHSGAAAFRSRRISFTFRKVLDAARRRSGLCLADVVYPTAARLVEACTAEEPHQQLLTEVLQLCPFAGPLGADDEPMQHTPQCGDIETHTKSGRCLVWNARDTAQRVYSAYEDHMAAPPEVTQQPDDTVEEVCLAGCVFTAEQLAAYVQGLPQGSAEGVARFVLLALLERHPAGELLMREGLCDVGKRGTACFTVCAGGRDREWSPGAAVRALFRLSHGRKQKQKQKQKPQQQQQQPRRERGRGEGEQVEAAGVIAEANAAAAAAAATVTTAAAAKVSSTSPARTQAEAVEGGAEADAATVDEV